MDCLSATSPIQEVVFCAGAQLGKTETGNNWIGYIIDHAPGPALSVLPTLGAAKKSSKQRIKPLIESSPRLAEKVKPARARDSGNETFSKEFPGGILMLTGANSASGLRMMPVRYVFLDEIDGYPGDVDGEGDPVNLAKARARNFARRKIFEASTPTTDELSRIASAYEDSDQRRYRVPCPHCGEFQEIEWARIRWPKGRPEEAVFICEHCENEIQEHFKTQMLLGGQWVARNPDHPNKKRAGFHLSSLYSPAGWLSWGEIARLWEEAQGKPLLLKTFVNTILAEVWKENCDAPDWRRIYERRETYSIGLVPDEAIFLTAGVDVQKDRLEFEVVAWGADKQSWSIDYRILSGDTSDDVIWCKLAEVLNESFSCTDGCAMPIAMMAVDSGYNTQIVYNWVRQFPANRVIATKGWEKQPIVIGKPKPVDVDIRGRTFKRGVHLWPIGTSVAKTELYGWLRLNKPTTPGELYPAGYCHFPEHGEDYFKQLTAEEMKIIATKGGGRRFEWVKRKGQERNEALDCRILARAAASVCGLDRYSEEQLRQMRNIQPKPIAVNQQSAQAQQSPATRPRRDNPYL